MTRYSRREFLQISAVTGIGALAAACTSAPGASAPAGSAPAGSAPAGSPGASPSGGGAVAAGPLNFLTWSDHWNKDALAQVRDEDGIVVNVSELSDNADGFAKVKQVGGQLDIVSGDALWVPEYHKNELVAAFDLASLEVSQQLYPMAKSFEFFSAPDGYLAYPWGWSPIQLVYNPANVSPAPDTWQVLVDPKYESRIVMENQPVDIMLLVAKAIGAKDGYNMTDDELAQAKSFLEQMKPNVLKLVAQNTETISALADGSAWIATQNLGAQDRVKDAGGPAVEAVVPKEGTTGFIDGEMSVQGAENADRIKPYLEIAAQAEWVAQNFLDNGRPLFNEQAYQLLVDGGNKDRADRYLYNEPETALEMTLKGPGGRVEDYIDTFNSVFGA
jgi:spermidine/putrescine-binding protein